MRQKNKFGLKIAFFESWAFTDWSKAIKISIHAIGNVLSLEGFLGQGNELNKCYASFNILIKLYNRIWWFWPIQLGFAMSHKLPTIASQVLLHEA